MRTLVRSLNILIAVLASCVLGLALYGVLRPPVAVSATGAPHTEELAQAPDQGSPDGENQTGDLWQQGLGQTEQGNWAAAIDDLEGALEQSPEIPERYLLLAQAYREAERDDDAAEVLRRGMETTGAESLELPLKAVESTLEMPEDQRTCLDALYHAFADGDETSSSAALEDWRTGKGCGILKESTRKILSGSKLETWRGTASGSGPITPALVFCSGGPASSMGRSLRMYPMGRAAVPRSIPGIRTAALWATYGWMASGKTAWRSERWRSTRPVHRCRGHLYNVRHDGHAGRNGGRGDRPRRGHHAAASEWRHPYLPAHLPGRGSSSGTLPQWRRVLLRPLRLRGTSCDGRRFVFHPLSGSISLGEGEPLSGAMAVPQLLLWVLRKKP